MSWGLNGVHMIRVKVFWGLYGDPTIRGNDHMGNDGLHICCREGHPSCNLGHVGHYA